jgi:Asp-tRNA(Asn)/Glu-tRNA(Gln) amidotransferase A subunit family amidase
MPEPLGNDAIETARLVREREVSAAEVVADTLARIEDRDPEVNAFTEIGAEGALAAARAADRALACGEEVGPLHGVPVAVKDVIWLEGWRATNGSLALRDFVAPEDAVAVARLRAAGAIVVGKTNNPEFCLRGFTDNPVFGATRNPSDPTKTAGGSSGGSGAAVAAGMVPLALGSDGGGSVRIPSSFCGVAGLKPSFGAVPTWPGFRGWETLNVVGPIASSVRDLALALAVLAADPQERLQSPARPRAAFTVDQGFSPVEPDVREAFDRALSALDAAGWQLEETTPTREDPEPLWNTIALCEGYAALRDMLDGEITADSRELIQQGASISAVDYLDAGYERARFARLWDALLEPYDVLLSPTLPLTAFPIGTTAPTEIDGVPLDPRFDAWCAPCLAANLTGRPAVSLPCGLDGGGMPIGLQMFGRRSGDSELLMLAGQAAEVLDPAARPRSKEE